MKSETQNDYVDAGTLKCNDKQTSKQEPFRIIEYKKTEYDLKISKIKNIIICLLTVLLVLTIIAFITNAIILKKKNKYNTEFNSTN